MKEEKEGCAGNACRAPAHAYSEDWKRGLKRKG